MRSDTLELSSKKFNFLAAQWRVIFTFGCKSQVFGQEERSEGNILGAVAGSKLCDEIGSAVFIVV